MRLDGMEDSMNLVCSQEWELRRLGLTVLAVYAKQWWGWRMRR